MSDNKLAELWREARCVDGIKHAPCMGMVAIGDQMLVDNAALRDTMIAQDAHEAGLAEAQAYLMNRVKVLGDALHLIVASGSDDTYAVGIARAALEKP